MEITFITWDDATDGVAVLHDGVEVWRENSLGYFDQYFQFVMPKNVPVTLRCATREDGELNFTENT